jgi:uracil-DNA glycosylase family 4
LKAEVGKREVESILCDFLECVQQLKKELTFQVSQGEKWVLGFGACDQPLPPSNRLPASTSAFSLQPSVFPSAFPIIFLRLSPSASEQESGIPYSDEGAALLDKIIAAMQWNPKEIYKTYLCPSSSDHFSEEQFRDCAEKFYTQIAPFQPKIVIAWGERVSQILAGKNCETSFFSHPKGFTLMSSLDPLYLIKRPEHKKKVWEDLQKLKKGYNA